MTASIPALRFHSSDRSSACRRFDRCRRVERVNNPGQPFITGAFVESPAPLARQPDSGPRRRDGRRGWQRTSVDAHAGVPQRAGFRRSSPRARRAHGADRKSRGGSQTVSPSARQSLPINRQLGLPAGGTTDCIARLRDRSGSRMGTPRGAWFLRPTHTRARACLRL